VLVSADVQLAVFGLVNKVLDYLLDTVLEHTVSVALTVWMACECGSIRPIPCSINMLRFFPSQRHHQRSLSWDQGHGFLDEGRAVQAMDSLFCFLQALAQRWLAVEISPSLFDLFIRFLLRAASRSRSQHHRHSKVSMVSQLLGRSAECGSDPHPSTHADDQYEPGWSLGAGILHERSDRSECHRPDCSRSVRLRSILGTVELVRAFIAYFPDSGVLNSCSIDGRP
jgi:hypothetical protein